MPMADARLPTVVAAKVPFDQFDALVWFVRCLKRFGGDGTLAAAVHAFGGQHMKVAEVFNAQVVSRGKYDSLVHALFYITRSTY